MELTVNIDPIYNTDKFSVQIDLHPLQKTVILDDPVKDAKDGLWQVIKYLQDLDLKSVKIDN